MLEVIRNKEKLNNFNIIFIIILCSSILISEILLRLDAILFFGDFNLDTFIVIEALTKFYENFTNPVVPSVMLLGGLFCLYISLKMFLQVYISKSEVTNLLISDLEGKKHINTHYFLVCFIIAVISIFLTLVVFRYFSHLLLGFNIYDLFFLLKVRNPNTSNIVADFYLYLELIVLFSLILIIFINIICKISIKNYVKFKNNDMETPYLIFCSSLLVNVILLFILLYNSYIIIPIYNYSVFYLATPIFQIILSIALINILSLTIPPIIARIHKEDIKTTDLLIISILILYLLIL